jgi:hypothetical protein
VQVLRPAAIQPALANVPSYLIPETPAAPDLTPHVFDESNVGHKRGYDSDDEVDRSYGGKRSKRKHNDPLRSMNYDMGVVKERYSKHDGCPRPRYDFDWLCHQSPSFCLSGLCFSSQ